MRPRLRFLSDELIDKIVDQARGLLCGLGVNLHHDRLLSLFGDHGCRVDRENKRVWFTQDLIDRCLKSAPRAVRLWNVAGTSCRDLSGDNVHFTPGSAAIKMLDAATRRIRPATLADAMRYAKLVSRLSHIDYPSTAVVPGDVPSSVGDSIRLYALLLTNTRPIVTGAFTVAGFDVMRDLQLAVRGTGQALRERPFAMFSCCPTSPLKWSDVTAGNTMKAAELGIPVEFISMPLPGLVAPVTLVGSLIQHTAETLSGILISQTVRPGAPVVYGGSPAGFDMRALAAVISSLEAQMMCCAYAEIGKRFGLPTQAYIGLSDSKDLDAQAGFETGTGLYLAALSGVNSLSGPGMLYFESCHSLEKLVLDDELCGMSRRLIAGIEPRDDFPAEPLFSLLLETKNLLDADHTLKHFRGEHYVPGDLIDRRPVGDVSVELPSLVDRAAKEVRRRLSQYQPPGVLSDDSIRELHRVMAAAGGTEVVRRVGELVDSGA